MRRNVFRNQLLASVLAAVITFAAGSCCTKKMCTGADSMDMILFDNFSDSELDTLVIQRFNKNTNFVTAIENTTVITSNFSQGSSFKYIPLPLRLTTDFDYKIRILSTGQDFTISDFVTKKETCNTGFMCNDSYNALESYKVNGSVKKSFQLELSK